MKRWEMAVICAIGIWNVVVFFLYGIDKYKARKGRWRISENVLLTVAFFMGGLGAALGMAVFHHKTRHLKFQILVPLALIFNLAVLAGMVYLGYKRG